MSATVLNHPQRVRRLFLLTRDPMHPDYHKALSGMRRAAFDPTVREFHRQALQERLAQIEQIGPGHAYVPPQEPA